MKKILIVEDDKFLSDLYCEILKSEDFRVICADDGEKGYEEMKKGNYDLVLLDVMLPKIDGVEILKRLKKEGHLEKEKIIFLLTNLGIETVSQKIGRIEVDEYLVKSSLTPGELVRKIKSYLG